MNLKIAGNKWLPSLSARAISTEEVTLSFFDIQGTSAGQKTWRETQLENIRRKMIKPTTAKGDTEFPLGY